jgi:non-specific serine/threonine protein kinase
LLGTEQKRWSEQLEAEHANMRAALAWLSDHEPEWALRLSGTLFLFWFLRGHLREGTAWLESTLARAPEAPPEQRLWALFGTGMLTWARGEFGQAETIGQRALLIAHEHDLMSGRGFALYLLFLATMMQGRGAEALRLGEQVVEGLRAADAEVWLAFALADVGTQLMAAGAHDRGEAWVEEGLELHRAHGNNLGLGNKLSDLGRISYEAGDLPAAARLYAESLRWLLEGGDTWYLASPVEGLAAIALATGQATPAARLLGAAAALRERSGATVWPKERGRRERAEAAARAALGEESYDQEVTAGHALPFAGMIAEATAAAEAAVRAAAPPPPPTPAEAAGLSPREQEVLRLLVAGKSNPEIADALFIGRGTFKTHVTNILAKLDAASRTEAAAIAHQRGLL